VRSIARAIYKDFPEPVYECNFEEAEMVKYFINAFYATKVIYANQMYDLCESMGVDYNVVKTLAVKDKRISDSHFNVMHKGYRGFGGKCIPKDTKAITALAESLGIDFSFLKSILEINERLLNENDIHG